MSLGLGVTLLLTLALVGTNFQREIAKSIPDIAPDYFFVGIQKGEREKFEQGILNMDPNASIEIVPMVSSGIVKINGVDPNTYICLLYTSPSPRDRTRSRMPSSA